MSDHESSGLVAIAMAGSISLKETVGAASCRPARDIVAAHRKLTYYAHCRYVRVETGVVGLG